MDDTSRRVRNGVNDVTGGPTDHARAEAADDATNVDERAREIRHEIEETRVELTETIDAIQEKLKPRNRCSALSLKCAQTNPRLSTPVS